MTALDATAPPGPVRAFWRAARPATLPAAVAPVAVGTAVAAAEGAARPGPALAALGGALLLQVAANYVNDFADHERGADGAGRLGPPRAAQSGWLTTGALRAGALCALAAAAAVGVYLVAQGGWPIAVGGALAAAAAWAYTAGPVPLGYRGLGDVLVFAFFGLFAVAGTHLVQAGETAPLAWACAVPVGALATAILHANNLRDRDGDARAGKRTLAVRLGPRGARRFGVALVAVAYAGLPLLPAFGAPWTAAFLPALSLPLAVRLARRLLRAEGAGLAPALGEAARLELAFAGLLALGLVW